MQFSFAQVEKALAHTFGISERPKFVHRLQHIQKIDFLPETKTGRGRAAVYRAEHILQLGVLLELGQLGYTPERAKGLIEENRVNIGLATLATIEQATAPRKKYADPIVLSIVPWGLADLLSPEARASIPREMLYDNLGNVSERMAAQLQNPSTPRLALVSLSNLVDRLVAELEGEGAPRDKTYEALVAWADKIAAEDFDVVD